jgi:hypothetical protein
MYPKIHIPVRAMGANWDLHQDGFWLGVVALALTAAVVLCYIWLPDALILKPTRLLLLKLTAAAWAVIPPVYFLAEWWIYNPPNPESFAAFKYDQEKARDLWAAVGAVLGALLLSH